MLSRRSVLGVLFAVFLAGCTEQRKPAFGENAVVDFGVNKVVVTTTNLANGVEGRPNSISKQQVARDLSSAFDFVFANRRSGARKVNIAVDVRKIRLPPRLETAITPETSHLVADVRVTDTRTGQDVMPPTSFVGVSDYDVAQPVHIFSALTKLSVQDDYLDTIQSSAEQLNQVLFGQDGTRKFPGPLSGASG